MRLWMSASNALASAVITAKVRIHSLGAGSFQFSQRPPIPNGLPSFIAIALYRDNATTPTIGIPECWQDVHGLAFGIDRLAPARRVLAPIGNEAPAQRVECHLASLMIAPDYQQVLARRAVPPGRII